MRRRQSQRKLKQRLQRKVEEAKKAVKSAVGKGGKSDDSNS